MVTRSVMKPLLIAAACALAIALMPAETVAQSKSKKSVPVPPGGCAITNAALEGGQTCAAKCGAEQWCPVMWCVQGKLEQTIFSCYEPSGVCVPKC
jgi:hypothetical protein